MRADAPQREYPLRDLFNALRCLAHTGCPWRWLPHTLPLWAMVYQQCTRWRDARAFEPIAHSLNELQRVLRGHKATLSVVVLDGRMLQSTPESGHRAGYDGAKKRKGSKVHIAVDTLGQLLSVVITPANEQERTQSVSCVGRCTKSRARPCQWASWTKATRAKRRSTRQPFIRLTCKQLKNPKTRLALWS